MTLTQITEKGIKDGEILNADINASAAIAKTKIETFVNNNADNRVITGSGTANTLNGESNVTIDSSARMTISSTAHGDALTLSSGGSTYGGSLHLTGTGSPNQDYVIAVGGGDGAYISGRGLLVRDITNSANRIGILTNGNLQIHDGDLKVASGHGIDFSATSDGSGMTNELLDDYEEGTWTPANGTFTTFNVTSSQIVARYTKIGDQVTVWINQTGGQIAWSQPQYISGLPFAVSVPSAGTFTNNYPNAGGEALIWAGERIYMAQSDGYNTNNYKMVFSATYRTIA